MRRDFASSNSIVKFSRTVYLLGVLLLVSGLIANVATRYSSATHLQAGQSSIQKGPSSYSHRQRLTKDALTWVPALILIAQIEAPAYICCALPPEPDFPALISYDSLFNRPPPVA
jgi:hypothetical protein